MSTLATLDLALADLAAAGAAVALADEAVSRNAIDRTLHESAVVNALVGNTNPLTNKPHSVTSAAEAAAQDDGTMRYRLDRVALDRAATEARTRYRIAEIRAWALAHAIGRTEV